jgi:hypothetical protein
MGPQYCHLLHHRYVWYQLVICHLPWQMLGSPSATDNGANFLAAVKVAKAKHTIAEGIRCACHTMNLW